MTYNFSSKIFCCFSNCQNFSCTISVFYRNFISNFHIQISVTCIHRYN